MSARLRSAQDVTDPRASLNPGDERIPPFAVVELDGQGRTYISIYTPAEAYALRDAFGRAGDLLAGAEGPAGPPPEGGHTAQMDGF
jgi:hypothetical protein